MESLDRIIRLLYVEKAKIDNAIAILEDFQAHRTKRRGRRSMSEEERWEVSDRMKKFWTDRRKRGVPPWARENRLKH